MRNEIGKLVQDSASFRAVSCHPIVRQGHGELLQRYSRLEAACTALESFIGFRPRDDDDLFEQLASRRRETADTLATLNLQAHIAEAVDGLYIAIPFFSNCSDLQRMLLVNRTAGEVTYVGRGVHAHASDDGGIVSFQGNTSAFRDRMGATSIAAPGGALQIGDYSMRVEGDFVSNYRLVLVIGGSRVEARVEVTKLAGFLWDRHCTGLHAVVIES